MLSDVLDCLATAIRERDLVSLQLHGPRQAASHARVVVHDQQV
jgi:hypothetical protein